MAVIVQPVAVQWGAISQLSLQWSPTLRLAPAPGVLTVFRFTGTLPLSGGARVETVTVADGSDCGVPPARYHLVLVAVAGRQAGDVVRGGCPGDGGDGGALAFDLVGGGGRAERRR